MIDECESCGICCLNTEMILSKKDVDLILKIHKSELKIEDFVIEINNYFELKNIKGHCIFFDNTTKKCKIYEVRPQGCRFYPLIYDSEKKLCILDKDCPKFHLFFQSKNEYKKTCIKIKNFVKNQLKLDL